MKGSPRPLTPRPLALAVRKAMGGVSLVELLLFAGVAAAGAVVILGMALNTNAAAKRQQAQSDVGEFKQRLLSSYGATANFTGLSIESAKAEELFPAGMLDPLTRDPITPWGGAVRVLPTARPGRPADSSAVISMEGVPAADCALLVSSLATGFSEVVVNNITVGAGRQLDVGQLGEACSGRRGNLIQLFLDDPHAQEELGQCAGGGTLETEIQACPAGQLGSITMQRLLSCPTSYEDAVPGPWTQTANTCAPACELPTPNPVAETRPGGSCPVGQLGTITESRTLTYSCPAPTGSPTVEHSEWSVSENTCAPICVAPAPSTDSRTLECPAGQLGEIVQEQTTTWTCPAPTGSPVSTTSGWTTTSNTCAPECVAPAPTTDARTQECPAGEWGKVEEEQTTTWACPALTGLPTSTTTAWTQTANTCATCPAPSSETDTDWEPRSKACPSGQSGSHTWEEQRRRTRSVSYDCPAGTSSLPSPTHGSWSGWSWTGTKRSERNTCAPSCAPYSYWMTRADYRNAGQKVADCPAGYLGQHVRYRDEYRDRKYNFTCPNSTTATNEWSAWYPTSDWRVSNTCRLPRSCTADQYYFFWGGGRCTGRSPGTVIPHNGWLHLSSERNPVNGTYTPGAASFRCNDGQIVGTNPGPGSWCGN